MDGMATKQRRPADWNNLIHLVTHGSPSKTRLMLFERPLLAAALDLTQLHVERLQINEQNGGRSPTFGSMYAVA